MTAGRLIAVVGPSGVGKDSVMAGLHDVMPHLHKVRRVITRAPGLGGEDYDPVTEAEFQEMRGNGAFCVSWGAHGLFYGIPVSVKYHLNRGTDCLVNFSRKALVEGADASQSRKSASVLPRPKSPFRMGLYASPLAMMARFIKP